MVCISCMLPVALLFLHQAIAWYVPPCLGGAGRGAGRPSMWTELTSCSIRPLRIQKLFMGEKKIENSDAAGKGAAPSGKGEPAVAAKAAAGDNAGPSDAGHVRRRNAS